MFRFVTVSKGQRVAVWNRKGELRIVDGPGRLFLGSETVQPLPRFIAGPTEYLEVRFRDGQRTHVRGPAAVWLDPVEHESISVKPAVPVDSNEAVVVYKREATGVSRRVERGPLLFVPAADEWLHEFSWHGSDPKDRRHKVPHALKFSKLRVIPDQTYVDVDAVRTADDTLVTVKLMVFFELCEIEVMLDQTHDPVADFVNAVTADVMEFAAGLPFEAFKEQTARLNTLETYRQLAQRAARIGYAVTKVVYRGYEASAKLQGMHDGAIEARTKLRLEAETEEQAQRLADLKLTRERERAVQRQAMQVDEADHQRRMSRAAHEENLRQQAAATEARLENQRAEGVLEQEQAAAQHAARLAFLRGMREMDVDLTRYLVSRFQHPDRVIRIDGANSGTQMHLHEQN